MLLEAGLCAASIGFIVWKQLPIARGVATGFVALAILGVWRLARVHGERACYLAIGLLCAAFAALATRHPDGFFEGLAAGVQLKVVMLAPLVGGVIETRKLAKLANRARLDDVFR